uniref:DUF4340 domain-containing protein n=1 Tax=Luteolibacter marinus TaxID=2776705 RepID=UPI0018679218
MNKRQVVVLWIIAIILAVAAFFARTNTSKGFESNTKRDRGQTLIADLPAGDVAKIQVTSGEDSATLVRKDGSWSVENRDGYPASVTQVNEFLRGLAEVKVTQGIETEPSFAPRFGMDPDAKDAVDRGIDVVLSNDAGTELAHVSFGKNLESGGDPMSMMGGGASGRFIRNHADESGIYVVSELFPSLSPEPKRWLKDDFIKIEKIKSITVSPEAKAGDVAWKVTRDDESAEFTLEGAKDGETVSTSATSPLKSLFSYARFEDVVPEDQVDELGNLLKKRTVVIETFEGFTYTIGITPVYPDKEEPAMSEDAPPEQTFLMTVDVTADLPAERKKDEQETEDDAKAKDEAFKKRHEELEQRLAADKKFAGIVFRVGSYTVSAVMKERDELIEK